MGKWLFGAQIQSVACRKFLLNLATITGILHTKPRQLRRFLCTNYVILLD